MIKRIFVDKNGDVLGLYDEKFGNITDYGKRTIQRASTVEYNNTTEKWEVRVPDDEAINSTIPEKDWILIGSFPTREEALTYEKQVVESRFKLRLMTGKTHGPQTQREETDTV